MAVAEMRADWLGVRPGGCLMSAFCRAFLVVRRTLRSWSTLDSGEPGRTLTNEVPDREENWDNSGGSSERGFGATSLESLKALP